MTSTAPGAHPRPEEVDALLDPSGGDAQVAAHVVGCGRCQHVRDGLLQVRALLGEQARALPPEPPDLGARIAAALAAQPPLSAPSAREDERHAAVVALDSRRRRPWTTWLAAAASVAVIAVGGGVVATQLDVGGGGDAGTAAGAPEAAVQEDTSGGGFAPNSLSGDDGSPPQPGDASGPSFADETVRSSGTDYTGPELVAQVQRLLLVGGGTESSVQGRDEHRLADADGVGSCLVAVGRPGTEPLVTDLATFEGEPAAVLVLAAPDGYDVLVVPERCGSGDDRVLASAHLD